MYSDNFEKMLQKYADVTVHVGLNLRKGQRLTVRALLDDAPFVHKVTESAYKAGARFVDVLWIDERLTRIRFEHADPESITEVPLSAAQLVSRTLVWLAILSAGVGVVSSASPLHYLDDQLLEELLAG